MQERTARMTPNTIAAFSTDVLSLGEEIEVRTVRSPLSSSDQRKALEQNFAGRCQTEDAAENDALSFGHSIGSGLDVVCRASANDVCMRDAQHQLHSRLVVTRSLSYSMHLHRNEISTEKKQLI
jgi:hypothetical protein